ncbi:hypothetical protein BCE75_103263 [Isoptericola sp. CG 20/1183]|uniref:Uncharacterized protein n=1 Tax=Isoptericola halotolerans TaxID=300560 RepID=A0ABX5EGF4_9MICO|nr:MULTISPECIES: hypothetical protein [Isoptericola]MCK0116448.1 hypothetical protein [Isoptericola sp. S6320L]PRZ08334.1 hypothetical protein BCL65_103264 [Isoptericola halotolerans]PRZ09131.1 hypothetical protein BCE75_103263 [Isoptericola sp. CG 20/1183]
MIKRWRDRQLTKRVKPGDGRPLPRYRWWHVLSRSLFALDLPAPAGAPAGGTSSYAVDVRHLGDGSDGEVRARLYVDGALHLVSRLPARFPVPGGVIEVATSAFGMKRCHFVTADGAERLLAPDPRSAEGRRARLARDHPRASRVVGALSTVAVLVGLCVAIPAIIEPISQIPLIAESVGVFESPVDLPVWGGVAVGLAAVLGSVERALRLRSSWLDNLAS